MPFTQILKHLAVTAVATTRKSFRPNLSRLCEARSFLLLQYSPWLGSAVHATPLIPALRAAVPQAEIVVCASGLSLEIFRNNPGVDRLVPTPDPTKDLFAAARAIRAALPLGRPFAAVTATHSERTTIALAGMLAGAGDFVGFTQSPALYTRALPYNPSIPRLENNLRIVEALGHPPAVHFEPQVFFSADDLAYARTLISRFGDPTRPLLALVTQTSLTQRKNWRPERFAAAAEALIDRHNANLLLPGSAAERFRVAELAQRIGPRALNAAGETTLNQLAALLSLCAAGLTLDTGVMHLGRAVGLPMVILAPAWSPIQEWLPLGDSRYIILKNLDLPVCPPAYVIDEVSVDEAVAAMNRLLSANPTP